MPRLDNETIQSLQDKLDPEQERIAFKDGTEPAGTSSLNAEKRDGMYHCAVCDNPLFKSEQKFESGTGWPSFFDTAGPEALETKLDFKLILPRTEFHCARCGAHVGHVFKDGPEPTGQRWCANGAVLDFKPENEDSPS